MNYAPACATFHHRRRLLRASIRVEKFEGLWLWCVDGMLCITDGSHTPAQARRKAEDWIDEGRMLRRVA